MVNPVIKNKALVSFHDPDKRIGRYYSPNGVPSDLHIVVACSASRLSGLGKRKFIADWQLWVVMQSIELCKVSLFVNPSLALIISLRGE